MSTSALEPAAAAAMLQSAAAAIRVELSSLPEPALTFHPAPGDWCVKEVLGHLIESEGRGFAGRIRFILAAGERAGEGLKLEGWDQEIVARERNDCARDGAALVAEFDRIRADSVKLAAGLSAADLARSGSHRVGILTVRDLLHEWVHHDRNHMRQMLANVQAYAWPHMGNAQRFSQS